MYVMSHDQTGYHITDTITETTTTYQDRDDWIAACLVLLTEHGRRMDACLARLEASYTRTPTIIETAATAA